MLYIPRFDLLKLNVIEDIEAKIFNLLKEVSHINIHFELSEIISRLE
jgi:hypothetical protein